MALILGLDLGAYAVKALVIEASFRSSEVRRYAEVKLVGEDRQVALAAALQKLAENRGLMADVVAVALPGTAAASQVLTLPFKNDKQIDQALPGLVEGDMMLELDQIVFDHVPMATGGDAKTDLLVGAVRREEMIGLIEKLKLAAAEPRVVTLASLAYLSLLDNLPGDPDAVQAIVDIGHERVTVLVGTPSGGVEWARSFTGGGAELNRALAADFKVPLEEAREWKEQHADLRDRSRTPDEEAAYGALRRGLGGVIRELRTTLRAHTARFKKPITAVHLCGGTSQIKGLDALLTRELHLPFAMLALPQLGEAVPAADVPRAALGYALALRGQASNNKAARFNLRKGEFGFKSDFEYLKGKLGRLGAYAAILLFLSGVLGYAKLSSLSAREKVLDAKLCESTTKVLGKCQPDYNIALSMLREHNAPSSGLPQTSAIEILAETTSRIPAETAAKVTEIEMTAGRMRLRGTVDSFDSVDKLTASLKTYKCFTNITKGRTEKDAKTPSRIAFTLDVEVNCAPPPQG